MTDHNTKQRQADIRQLGKHQRSGLAAGVIWWGLGGILFLVLCILSAIVA